ncbi:hypothetical protein JYB64_05855 [Algoriphagus aestuarii]|nr:hypothetical protein [Algoriphagus aestuarii]
MSKKKDKLTAQIEDLTKKMKSQMPRIKKKILIWEQKAGLNFSSILKAQTGGDFFYLNTFLVSFCSKLL